uniref:Uncharacterized protein n=1 Tax=Bionectria ochroleuca TaxID=29856 RepID=A0A8H7NJD2_BIOOC
MSYYENAQQWAGGPTPQQNNWEHQGATTPVRAGASAPQPQDEYAFSYQFDEVDRAYENLQKSGKGFMSGGRRKFSPMHHGPNSARSTPDFDGRVGHGGPRSHSITSFDESRGSGQGANLNNFYAPQRHQSSRGSNEAEQVMQAKRRMAAQRERELRNLHTEQQYQRNALAEVAAPPNNKHMSEEETRELIARQRSALYGEGPFADKNSYVDETGNIRTGAPGPNGPPSLRGASPLTFGSASRAPQAERLALLAPSLIMLLPPPIRALDHRARQALKPRALPTRSLTTLWASKAAPAPLAPLADRHPVILPLGVPSRANLVPV